ncbi:MAG: VOC family protein [Myxococcota bacterium]|nr:VOC family protein [Myxococcota bacterium]
MSIQSHGLSHLHIHVRELDRSLRFYEAFGFVRVAGHDDLHFLVRPGHSDLLTLRVSPDPKIDHFGFMLEDASQIETAIEELTARGGRVVERLQLGENVPSAILEDPDGYHVQI